MFNLTKVHRDEITEGQRRIRLGNRVPKDAVNLGYVYSAPLNPRENVQVTDLSGFVLENIVDQSVSDIELWPNDQGLLTTWSGEPEIGNRNFSLTNEFAGEEPLYYMYELRYPILDTSKKAGYANSGVMIVDARGEELSGEYVYKTSLVPTDEENVYKVRVFTNFQKQPNQTIRAVYTAFNEGRIMPGFSEDVNPHHAFERSSSVEEVSLEPGKTLSYYQANGKNVGQSQIYVGIVPIRNEDWRQPIRFRYRLVATATKGEESKTITTPWLYESLYGKNDLVEADVGYRNGYKMLGGKMASEILRPFGDMTLFDDPESFVEYRAESSVEDVEIHTQEDGTNHVLATTEKQTATIELPTSFRTQYRSTDYPFQLQVQVDEEEPFFVSGSVNILEGHKEVAGPFEGEIVKVALVRPYDPVNVYMKENKIYVYTEETDVYYVPKFSLQASNNRQIRVLPPAERYANENWYLRIKNGQFSRKSAAATGFNLTQLYSLPEYFRQDFDEEYEMPIRRVLEEDAEIVGERKIRVRYTPLYVRQEEGNRYNVEVRVNGIIANVQAWIVSDGIIEVDVRLKENDEVKVTYCYEELAYTYRGFWDEERNRYWTLDLNPGPGHTYTHLDKESGEISERPTVHLINEIVYIYMRPTAKFSENKELVRGSYEKDSVYHTFEESTEDNHILLGKVMVRPNSSYEDMQLIDTRVRGGGLKESVSEMTMKTIEPESMSYWDIGYHDGEPYTENGVMIVRLPQYILKEYGGELTQEQVEERVKVHIGYGNLPIIEYIEEPRRLLERTEGLSVGEE